MLDGCTKLICSIKKEKVQDETEEQIIYKIKDCNGDSVWETNENTPISKALYAKTKKYLELCKKPENRGYASDNQMVWMLAVKPKEGETSYKNIAVCKRFQYAMDEINVHIKQLIYNIPNELNKTKTYQALWGDKESEIEFLEVNIDKYIGEQSDLQKRDTYIYSLISAETPNMTESLKNISRKIRASFVEGKIASDYELKKDGIWNPSGAGIDGDIYEHYKKIPVPHQ